MTVRQQIINRLKANLEAIAVGVVLTLSDDSTYVCQNTLAGRVFVWRTSKLEDTSLGRTGEPFFVNLRDFDSQKRREGVEVGKHEHSLLIDIDVPVRGGTAEDTVRDLLADLAAAVGADPKLGGLARWTSIETDRLTVEEGGQRIAGGGLSLVVSYRTALWRM